MDVDVSGTREGEIERFVPEVWGGSLIEAEHVARYRWAAPAVAGRRVLDAGCGMAYGTRMLAEAGAREVVGVDRARPMLEVAARSLPDTAAVTLRPADVRALPFEDGEFDVVVCFEVIEHVPDPVELLDELRRVLAADGVLLCSTPNRDVYRAGNVHHLHELTADEFDAALRQRFAHVRLAPQESWLCSTIASGGPAEAMPATDRSVERAEPPTYVVAAASAVELPPLAPVATLGAPVEWRAWEARAAHLERLATSAQARAGELEAALRERDELRLALVDAEQELAALRGRG